MARCAAFAFPKRDANQAHHLPYAFVLLSAVDCLRHPRRDLATEAPSRVGHRPCLVGDAVIQLTSDRNQRVSSIALHRRGPRMKQPSCRSYLALNGG
jgi:hypothetical protein